MKKLFLIALTLVFVVSAAAAEEKCEVGVGDAPALFNLKLGMTGKEAERAVGGKLKIRKVKEKGVIFQSYVKKSPPAFLSGVRVLYLRFFAAKLYQIEIFYEPTGITLEDFVRQTSARQQIPFDAWQIKYGIARLKCEGFSIEADNFLNPRIELTDDHARKEFQESQKDKKTKSKI